MVESFLIITICILIMIIIYLLDIKQSRKYKISLGILEANKDELQGYKEEIDRCIQYRTIENHFFKLLKKQK